MKTKRDHLNSSHLPYRYRRVPPLVASLRGMDAEDTIVRRCAAEPHELELAYEIAFEALRRYDDEVKYIPEGAWFFAVRESERAELQRVRYQQRECAGLRLAAARLVEELSHKVTSDELFLAAWHALSHFRVRARR